MSRLNAANNAETTLSTAITATDTAMTVTDASPFPDAPFRITVNAEIIEVGGVDLSTNRLTSLTRAIEGTSASSHEAGATVQNRLTAGSYNELATTVYVDQEVQSANDSLTTHMNNTDNPHSVNASQVGAPTIADFNNHLNNTSNPHNVTPEQIGALSTTNPQRIQESLGLSTTNPGYLLWSADNSQYARMRFYHENSQGTAYSNPWIEFMVSGTRLLNLYESGFAALFGDLIIDKAGPGLKFNSGQANQTVIYWNANATNDFGLNFDVNGTRALQLFNDANASFHGTIRSVKPLSTSNLVLDLQQGYGIYSDNTGVGSSNTRLWLDAPTGGQIMVGPRDYSTLAEFRVNADVTKFVSDREITRLIGGVASYQSFYTDYFSGQIGFNVTGNTQFQVKNNHGPVVLNPENNEFHFFRTGDAIAVGQIHFTQQGRLKFYPGYLQSRNTEDTAFEGFQGSEFLVSSDRAGKEDIKNVNTSVLNEINKTQVYEYKLKSKEESNNHVGLMYDEAPASVRNDDMKAIDLYGMTSYLWKAVQELTKEVEKLRGE